MQSIGNDPAVTLNEEIQAASFLNELLKQEQACLINANVEALPSLIDTKGQQIAKIAALANQRYKALTSIGCTGDEAGMQQWLTATNDKRVTESWYALLDQARIGKELNRVNGLLINKHLSRNESALQVLRGSPKPNTLYGPSGQATSNSKSRGYVIG